MFKKDKQSISIPPSKKIGGVVIRKMPIGAYLSAMEKIKEFPENFLSECFPGKTLQEVFDELSALNESGLTSMIMTLLTTAPKYVVGFVSELMEVDEDILLNDPEIGLDGLAALILAFIEVNRLGEFVSGAKEIQAKIKALVK